jgi:rhodanese-related sulfurtransferase
MTPTIDVGELRARMQSGDDFRIVDVRSRFEFEDKHLPGAVNLPWETEEDIARLAEALGLERGRLIVTYCSSPI